RPVSHERPTDGRHGRARRCGRVGAVARHLVCLTFDFDAVSAWIYRGQTTPTPISRGEFGVVAAGRILDLLRSRALGSTWFVPGHTLDHWPEVCRRVHAEGHEIGHHG